MFFMAGSTLAFFCRYHLWDDGIPTACNQSFYFQRHIVEPFSHLFFSFLNHISRNIKRAMYHSKLSAVGSKSFQCHASSKAFYYLHSKLPSALIMSTTRRGSHIIYYNNLQMEARSCMVNKGFLCIMTKPTLVELQKVLGSGIGLGLSASKPTKKNPFKGCIINDKLNSIELDDYIMDEYMRKPLMPYKGNGIDFIYME
jgi:hypothetical protein